MREDEELQSIDKRVKDLIGAEIMRKYNFGRPFTELPDMPFGNYAELKKAVGEKKAFLSVNSSGASTQFDIVAKKSEALTHLVALLIPYVIALLMIAAAFFLKNYFLLISILWLLIAGIFSSSSFNPPLYPFKGRRVADFAIILSGWALIVFNSYTIFLLAISYALMHWSYSLVRKIEQTVLVKRALQSELLFRFLYVTGKLLIFRQN